MKKRFKDLTIELTERLKVETFSFMVKNLKEKEHIGDLFNFVISAHLSSLFTMLTYFSEGEKEASEAVDKFIKNMIAFVKNEENITSIETIKEENNDK